MNITGYRTLDAEEVALINALKDAGAMMGKVLAEVSRHLQQQEAKAQAERNLQLSLSDDALEEDEDAEVNSELQRLRAAQPSRWLAIARTDIQQGLMAAVRAVAQPTNF